MVYDVAFCKAMLLYTAAQIKAHTEMLNDADCMGDSDHGTGMAIGFTAVENRLRSEAYSDLGSLFKACGMAILMSAGGASGALFGSFFKDGSKVLESHTVLDSQLFSHFLEAGVASVMRRGKASRGDKTMVDALLGASDCSQAHSDRPIVELLELCAQAAKRASDATKEMKASCGRMRTLSERSIGFVDPGSISVAIILASMASFSLSNQD